MHAEGPLRKIPLDSSKLMLQLTLALSRPGMYLRAVVDDAGTLVGGFWGVIGLVYWSSEPIALDRALFVLPTYRGGGVARTLIEDFLGWARTRGVKFCMIGQSTGISIDETRKLYERMGFETMGFNTLKELRDV
jgi:GNAT superfamily N-acetyltransferase